MNVKETNKIYCLYCKQILSEPKEMELGYHVSCHESFPPAISPQELKEKEKLIAKALGIPEKKIAKFFKDDKISYKENDEGKIIELNLFKTKLKSLYLSNEGLEELQSLIITNETEWDPHYWDYGVGDYEEIGLSELPANISELKKLKALDLTGNHIIILSENLLNLTSLETLNLTFNPIERFPENIDRLINLRKIILNYEEGKVEPPELTLTEKFSQLHQLEELRIYSAQIEKFPDSITNLKKLTTLVLTGKDGDIYRYRGFTGHYLNQLPDNIGNLTNLHYVDFSRHNLTYLPDGFGNLTNLDYLDLYHNSLTSLPESFKNLRHLKTLYLNNQIPYYKKNKSSQEKFNSFPDVLCELNSLEKLDLSQNFIRTLPDSIKNLQNLTTLNMGDNKLNFLPEGVYNLENLRSLSVMHNRLKEIPKTIENLTSLEVFDISANRSLKILPDSIIKLKNIKKLYLQGTGITELPGEIFELPDITLGLTRNQAQTFSKSLENRVNITLILYKNSYSWKEDTNYYRKHPRGLFN